MVYSIIYKSKAHTSFTIDGINVMLIRAKVFNKLNAITGCILYHNGEFIQLIEGKKELIELLYEAIKKDKRHYNVETIFQDFSNESLWSDWSMAFYNFQDKSDQSMYKRILLETAFENVNVDPSTSKVLLTLKQSTTTLLNQ